MFEKCQTQRFALVEENSNKKGGRRGRQVSDFGKQLLEKQKVRMLYGITERQFQKYIQESSALGKNSKEELLAKLESRIDNVAYRTGIAKTRRAGRQLAAHGHLTVNGTRVTVPSYSVKKNDVIAVRGGSANKTHIAEAKDRVADVTSPVWIEFDAKALVAKIKDTPNSTTVEMPFDLAQVLEFYSR